METTTEVQKTLVKPFFKIPEGHVIEPPRKSNEEKMYLLLIIFKDGERDDTFALVTGRTDAKNAGKNFVLEGADLEESRVIVEGNDITNSVTLYWFMKKMSTLYNDLGFDPDDYIEGDPKELVESSTQDIPRNDNEQVGVLYDPASNEEHDV